MGLTAKKVQKELNTMAQSTRQRQERPASTGSGLLRVMKAFQKGCAVMLVITAGNMIHIHGMHVSHCDVEYQ